MFPPFTRDPSSGYTSGFYVLFPGLSFSGPGIEFKKPAPLFYTDLNGIRFTVVGWIVQYVYPDCPVLSQDNTLESVIPVKVNGRVFTCHVINIKG